jgi:hypothetical protein
VDRTGVGGPCRLLTSVDARARNRADTAPTATAGPFDAMRRPWRDSIVTASGRSQTCGTGAISVPLTD